VTTREAPKDLVAQACAKYGREVVGRWCADLLAGRRAYDDPDAPSITWLGGAHAEAELHRGDLRERGQDYWVRVWAARGLRYAWTPGAARDVQAALADPAWRVRETAVKLVGLYELGEAADALVPLVDDEVPRVRAAAVRALRTVGEAEHAEAIRRAVEVPEASIALDQLRRRLDRDV
jgi:HEAT repeat protein